MALTVENRRTGVKTSPSATLPTINLAYNEMGSNTFSAVKGQPLTALATAMTGYSKNSL